jgi:hypothetical protein
MPTRRNAPAKPAKTTRAAKPLLAGRPFEVSAVTHEEKGNETDIFIIVGDVIIKVKGKPEGSTVFVSISRDDWSSESEPGEMSEGLELLHKYAVEVYDDPWKSILGIP